MMFAFCVGAKAFAGAVRMFIEVCGQVNDHVVVCDFLNSPLVEDV